MYKTADKQNARVQKEVGIVKFSAYGIACKGSEMKNKKRTHRL